MLTSVGRATARRVVGSSKAATLNLNLASGLAGRSPLVLRPAAAASVTATRSFSVSPWDLLAAKADAADGTKTSTKKKTSTTKKAAAPKKKKAAAKPKAKKPAPKNKKEKKVQTPEEQLKAKVKKLKKTALLKEEPSSQPFTAWLVYITENSPAERPKHETFGETAKALKAQFDNLSPSEKERLETQAAANKQANTEARKAWISSLPVEDVYSANLARRHLLRLLPNKRFFKLEDDRLPHPPPTPYAKFVKETGDFTNRSANEVLKDLGEQWKGLSDAEKQQYEGRYTEEKEAYTTELNAVKARAEQKKKEAKAADKAEKVVKKEAKASS